MSDDVSRYRIVRRIGRGGMAEVFEAVAAGAGGFERRVAVKRMLPGSDVESMPGRMFLDEARIVSQLHHANIVGIHDYGIVDGLPFQVLEFVDGCDLLRLVKCGDAHGEPMPLKVALYICSEVAHALAYAHDAVDTQARPLRIVHRDVKPANVLVSWAGDVRLADFGIAFAERRLETTTVGMVKGTLLYMAPEQTTNQPIDGRVDIFALGCVLHRLIVGRSPLAGEDVVMNVVAGAELEVSSELPEDIRAILVRALRRSRNDRYETALEMAEQLEAVLATRIDRNPKAVTENG